MLNSEVFATLCHNSETCRYCFESEGKGPLVAMLDSTLAVSGGDKSLLEDCLEDWEQKVAECPKCTKLVDQLELAAFVLGADFKTIRDGIREMEARGWSDNPIQTTSSVILYVERDSSQHGRYSIDSRPVSRHLASRVPDKTPEALCPCSKCAVM